MPSPKRNAVRSLLLAAIGGAALMNASALIAGADTLSRFAQWNQQLRQRVDDLIVYPLGADPHSSGDVLVSFRIGRDGKPGDIAILKSSGHAIFDEAAARLVSGLGRIGPVPSDRPIDEIVLKLSYGDPSPTVAESKRLARLDAQERLANDERNRSAISAGTEVAQTR